ncbi:MAG: gamma-glutamyl-gamma-aminobutyrate hydrolase family protein [Eubacteriales bacterium]|nr:gamma-glutamyl-gamma-aminobutyrate hydrolase family protein [Eubacteriales bacterium]
MSKLIGVTTSWMINEQGVRCAMLTTPYLEAVRAAGGVPVALFDGQGDIPALCEGLDGLLLSGGYDLDPALYGQENRDSEFIDQTRDAFEIALCRVFAQTGKPMLGICRGHQVITVAFGGTLHQDIGKELGVNHPNPCTHSLAIRPDSFLRPILGESHTVNSTHHQATLATPNGFMVTALAPDGVVEALQATDGRPIYGVQFHPERLYRDDPAALGIFELLL